MYKKTMYKLLIALSILLVLVLGFAIKFDIKNTVEITQKKTAMSEEIFEAGFVTMEIGNAQVKAELALTPDTQSKGLSGRPTLHDGEGMLFVYTKPDYYSFWMPGMNFPLDIIWFNQDFVVVDITENVTPESFPQKYTSSIPAQFVLEVPSGYAIKNNIKVGTQAFLQ